MDDSRLLLDLHRDGMRQGPGGDAETERALQISGVDREAPLNVADIGCGSGASTLILARNLNAHITAVDCFQEFLDILEARANEKGVAGRITPRACSMEELPFSTGELDLIWSEGAIYNMGFENGVAAWRPFLKENGVLAISEITWTTATRPAAINDHWTAEYPEIDVASAKLKVLEDQGYAPLGYFILPESCWLENFYRPLQARFPGFLERNRFSDEARAMIAVEEEEIQLYEQFSSYFSYGFYIARKQSAL